jgi:membrane-associated phospholipid phosphatase
VILAAYQRVSAMARFLVSSTVSLSIVYVVATVTPSYGAYVQHGMTDSLHPNFLVQFSDYKATYDALRTGVVDIYAPEIPGAISFPSFHTTTVVLYLWAAWNTPARWITLVVQTLCFLTIPVQGAHFFTDMIAGAAIGVGAIIFSVAVIREDTISKSQFWKLGAVAREPQIGGSNNQF